MKLLSILTLLFFYSFTHGQQFSPTLSASNRWTTVDYDWFSGITSYQHLSIDTSNTLLLNAFEYYKVIKSSDSLGQTWQDAGVYAAEDEGKLFVIDTGQNTAPACIMDLNLKVGDYFKFKSNIATSGLDSLIVQSIDTIQDLQGVDRKRINLSCRDLSWGYYWIEGIGPIDGMFSTSPEACAFDQGSWNTTCMSTNNIQVWKNPDHDQCWFNIIKNELIGNVMWISAYINGGENPPLFTCTYGLNFVNSYNNVQIQNREATILGVRQDGISYNASKVPFHKNNGRMYFWENQKWNLLYDFNAKVGDTVRYHTSSVSSYYLREIYGLVPEVYKEAGAAALKIKKIDTITTVSGHNLKRFYTEALVYDSINYHDMGIVLEDIGSLGGLFGYPLQSILPECLSSEPVGGIRCYFENGDVINFYEKGCYDLTSSQETRFENQVSVYPNPTFDKVTLQMDNVGINKFNFKIYNTVGEILKFGAITNDFSTIDIENLPSGIYFLRVFSKENQGITKKIIKQ